jgi:chemotaxis signal transduction protein
MGKEQYLGIAIDSIYDSAEIAKKDLQEHNSNQLCQGSLSKYIVRPQKNMSKTELLSVLDIQAMYKRILTNPKTDTTH